MANLFLLCTSCAMLLAHIQLLLPSYHTQNTPTVLCLLQTSYVLGPLTSILNHGTTNRYMQITDRITMTLGFLFDLFIIALFKSAKAATLILGSVACYIVAKTHPSCWWHPLSHLLVTMGHATLATHVHTQLVLQRQ